MEILRYYYGPCIELVENAPVRTLGQSYPGSPLRLGSKGEAVVVVKTMLNRISQNYPAVPKLFPVTTVFDEKTQSAVKTFQRIFNLTPDGIVGKAPGIRWSISMWASTSSPSWSAGAAV